MPKENTFHAVVAAALATLCAGSLFLAMAQAPASPQPLAKPLAKDAEAGRLNGTANLHPTALSASNPPSRTLPVNAPAEYRIGSGDILRIHVWKEPDASIPAVTVRSDGKIALPIVKEIEVAGLTLRELEKILTEKFSRFINDPEITVVAKEIQSEKVYLVGAVKKEGSFLLKSPMTVLQVLAEAGGFTDFAKKKKIYVLRTKNQNQSRLPFNYEAVIKGENMEQNILVLPGDTIVVPQ